MDAALRDTRDALAAPWDPPLDVQATVRSPRGAELVIAGIEHRVEGEDLNDCLERVAALVWEKLARPQRRRVAVSTGLTEGPTRILVDPVGAAEFFYDDDNDRATTTTGRRQRQGSVDPRSRTACVPD